MMNNMLKKIHPRRLFRSLRARLNLPLIAEELDEGTDKGVWRYYNSRPSRCSFLLDEDHYERPRVDWILKMVRGGTLLEIGCADGGMTQLLSPLVEKIIAVDVCESSIQELRSLDLPNVEATCALIEHYISPHQFRWIVMSEVIEHLRNPAKVIERCLGWLEDGGAVLVTSPNGRWESIEHLHEFNMNSWCQVLTEAGARQLQTFYLKDREGSDRWLGARLGMGENLPAW